jgi:hypothetical protein
MSSKRLSRAKHSTSSFKHMRFFIVISTTGGNKKNLNDNTRTQQRQSCPMRTAKETTTHKNYRLATVYFAKQERLTK